MYDKETLKESIKLLSNIHEVQHKDEEARSEVAYEKDQLEVEKEQKLAELTDERADREKHADIEIENKKDQFKIKVDEVNKLKEKYNNILEDIEPIREFLNNNYIHFADNKERYTRELAKIDPEKGLYEYAEAVNENYIHMKDKKDKSSKLNSKLNKVTSVIHDQIIEFRSGLGFRGTVISLAIVVYMFYKLAQLFKYISTYKKIIYIGIVIGVVVVIMLIRDRYLKGSVSKDIIYRTFNLIEGIENLCENSINEIEIKSKEADKKAEEFTEKIRSKMYKEIDDEYRVKEKEIIEEYEKEKELLESKSELNLGGLGIETSIMGLEEISDKKSGMPIMGKTTLKGKEIDIYYGSNHIIIEDKEENNSTSIQKYMENLIIELTDSEPLGKVNIKLVDSEGLGTNFSKVLKLKDSKHNIMDKKVYTTEEDISNMLDKSIKTISERILKILSEETQNIYEYNMKYPNNLGYEFIFIRDVDKIQDNKIKNKILKILQQGREWGVFIIMSGKEIPEQYKQDHTDLISVNRGKLKLNLYNNINIGVDIDIYDTNKLGKIFKEIGEENTEIEFKDMIPNELMEEDPSEFMDVPIGVTYSGRAQNVRLGGAGINHHILLGGNTGSGKTSFIHTFIISTCLRYSPELLELILIDFKQGVEFQLYADYQLPHAKFLGLESDREYALNILKYINNEIDKRSAMCKNTGTSDITTYNSMGPEVKMKRIIIIIDEFQELLRGQDSIEQDTRLLLDIITRIGRSFGVHLMLSSQSLIGIPGGLGGIESKLGTRIALRCNEDDSRAILSGNNTAAAELTERGSGIFNDNQGHINSNNKFIFGYIPDEERVELLKKIKLKSDQIGYKAQTKLFYKSKIRNIEAVEWFSKTDKDIIADKIDLNNTNILLGDSSSLTKPYVDINLTRQSGENLVIIAKDKKSYKYIKGTVIDSISYTKMNRINNDETAKIIEIDPEIQDDRENEVGYPGISHKIFGNKNAYIIVSNISDIIDDRVEDESDNVPIYLIINNGQLIRELQEDEYSSEVTKQLNKIMREGPYYGVHTINMVDTYRSLSRIRSKVLGESSHRLVGKMNDMDSSYIINDKRASLLSTDIEYIYYNDTSNEYDKVRVLKVN